MGNPQVCAGRICRDHAQAEIIFVVEGDLAATIDAARRYEPEASPAQWGREWRERWLIGVVDPCIGWVTQGIVLLLGSLHVVYGLAMLGHPAVDDTSLLR